jgi:hypothetical protein
MFFEPLEIKILNDLENGRNVFLTGGAGVGKTYTVRKLVELLQIKGRRFAVTASTGIAAKNLDEDCGTTIHYFLGTLDCSHKSMIDLCRKDRSVSDRVKNTEILIIDEVSMIGRSQFELFIEVLKIHGFSGKILFVGDFLQLPPVPDKDVHLSDSSLCFTSDDFQCKVYQLVGNKRNESHEFNVALVNLRFARTGGWFPSLIARLQSTAVKTATDDYIYLFATNKMVNVHNSQMFSKLDGESFLATGELAGDEAQCRMLLQSVRAELHFEFKVGARLMLIRNMPTLAGQGGYRNGDLCNVVSYDKKSNRLKVRFLDGVETVFDPYEFKRYEYTSDYSSRNVVAKFKQFPFRLAYAFTVHKSQGLSIDKLCIDCSGFFCEAQFYVAISRSSNLDNLVVKNYDEKIVVANDRAVLFYSELESNISYDYGVYKEHVLPKKQSITNRDSVESISSDLEISQDDRISRKKALEILADNDKTSGLMIINSRQFVFSNIGRNSLEWWVEPYIDSFENDLYIALNDHREKKIHLFKVPANSFKPVDKFLAIRNDVDRATVKIDAEDTSNFNDLNMALNPVCFRDYYMFPISY